MASGHIAYQTSFHLVPTFLVDKSFHAVTLDELQGKKVFGFAGIAHPEEFKRELNAYNMVGFKSFPDHYAYNEEDVDALIQEARAADSDILLTTEKDIVKLTGFSFPLPLYALRVDLFIEDEETFWQQLEKHFKAEKGGTERVQ